MERATGVPRSARAGAGSRVVALGAGAAIVVLAAAVLIGWWTRQPVLVQLHPTLAPFQLSAALGYLLLGAALLALAARWYRLALVAALAAISIGAATLLEYVAGVDLGVDDLALERQPADGASPAGRMAPNTMACLVFAGAALALLGLARGRAGVSTASLAGLLGATVAALGAVALIGYAGGVEAAYRWGELSRMPPHAAAGAVILGLGVVAQSWRSTASGVGLPAWVIVAAGFASLVVTLTIFSALSERAEAGLRRTVAGRVEGLRSGILEALSSQRLAIGRMARRWEAAGGTERAAWEADALRYITDEPSYHGFAYLGADGLTRWTAPRSLAGADYPGPRSSESLTAPLELGAARPGIALLEPLHQGADGYLVGFLYAGAFLRPHIIGALSDDYAAQVRDARGNVLFASGGEGDGSLAREASLERTGWTLRVTPQPAFVRASRSLLPELLLVGGGAMTALLVLSLALARTTGRQASALARGNVALLEEATRYAESNRQLESLRRRYASILAAAGEGVLVLDREGRTTIANPAAARLLGHSVEAMVGEPEHALAHHSYPDGRPYPRQACRVLAALTAGAVHRVDDDAFWRADGTSFPVEYTCAPMFDDGEVSGAVVVFRDVSARVEAERALEAAHATLERQVRSRTEDLHRSNAQLEQFAAVASHDLQEPLRKIRAFGERLARRADAGLDEAGRDYLRRMISAASRMQTLINDLLSLSRVSRAPPAFRSVSLAEVAAAVVSDLEVRIAERSADVSIHELGPVHGDPVQLHQLLLNLVSNALKFTRPGAPPQVVVREGAGRPGVRELRVEDRGIGFPPQHAERVFEPFERLHGRSEYEGNGIGLAICKSIAERHGGTIRAESVVGEGTVFVVTLPAADTVVSAA